MTRIDMERRSILSAGAAASVFAFTSPSKAATQSDLELTASNKKKVEAALTAWKDGTGSIQDLLTQDIRWTIVGNSLISGTVVGKPELDEKINRPFTARFAHSNNKFRPIAIKGIYGDGNIVIAFFEGLGIANDGKPYHNNYAWFLTMRDGLVSEGTAFFDSVAFNDMWTRVPDDR